MKVFVINLKRDVAKREAVAKRLESAAVDFEFVEAVYGKDIPSVELDRLCDFRKMRRIGRELTPGEIGCALSHLAIYDRIVRENIDVACVLEDDVIVAPAFRKVTEKGADFIRGKRAVMLLEESLGGWSAGRLCYCYNAVRLGNGFCTHAYLVTKESAEALCAFLRPVVRVADCWGTLVARGIVDLYGVSPTPTMVDLTFGSAITEWTERQVYKNRIDQLIQRIRHVFWRKYYAWSGA